MSADPVGLRESVRIRGASEALRDALYKFLLTYLHKNFVVEVFCGSDPTSFTDINLISAKPSPGAAL